MSILKPDQSVIAGLATAAVAYAAYQNDLPTLAECRTSDAGDPDLDSAERSATIKAAGLVGLVSLLTKDPTIFMIGGAVVIALAWSHRHANYIDPMTGRVAAAFGGAVQDVDED